jgi:glycosyltransferase domain-containing protein
MRTGIEKVTLIIPTHNRHHYLSRILRYYLEEQKVVNIIVADSSPDAFVGKVSSNVKYLHTPGMEYCDRMDLVLSMISTPYVFICADDDFIFLDAIEDGINTLEQNKEYATYNGFYFGLVVKNELRFSPMHTNTLTIDYKASTCHDRLNVFLSNYQQIHYSLYRTSVFKEVYAYLSRNRFTNGKLLELAASIVSVVNGAPYIVNKFYGIREAPDGIILRGSAQSNLDNLLESGENASEVALFYTSLIQYVKEKEELDEAGAKLLIHSSVDKYLFSMKETSPSSNLAYRSWLLNFVNISLPKFLSAKLIEKANKILISEYYLNEHSFGYRCVYNAIGFDHMKEVNEKLSLIKHFLAKEEV